jgi:2-isopropylmalate synthase
MIAEVPEITEYDVVVSVHCHNDLGCATANTLAGIKAGARQFEGTSNGIGERAGNAHLAEIIMALSTRADVYGVEHTINTALLGDTARLVSEILNKPIPSNLPVVGESVFAHGSGIHQHGVLGNPLVYEIMSPESVGWDAERFPLSSQSGRHGLRQRLLRLGYEVSDNILSDIYQQFLQVAATQPLVHNEQLCQLMGRYR